MSRVVLTPIYDIYWSLRHRRVVSGAHQAVEKKHSHIYCKAKKWIRESIAWRQNAKYTNTRNRREGNAVRQVGTWSVGGLPSRTQPQVGSSTSVGDLTFWHWDIWWLAHLAQPAGRWCILYVSGSRFWIAFTLGSADISQNVCKQINLTQFEIFIRHACTFSHWTDIDGHLSQKQKYQAVAKIWNMREGINKNGKHLRHLPLREGWISPAVKLFYQKKKTGVFWSKITVLSPL